MLPMTSIVAWILQRQLGSLTEAQLGTLRGGGVGGEGGPGVAQEFFFLISNFLNYVINWLTISVQKKSAHSVQSFGRLQGT